MGKDKFTRESTEVARLLSGVVVRVEVLTAFKGENAAAQHCSPAVSGRQRLIEVR